MSGRSQALRWPAKLRLQAKEVWLEQVGTGIWLQAEVPAEQDMGRWLEQFFARTEPLPDDFVADRQDPPALERVWT